MRDVHSVDFLQGPSLRLTDEEVNDKHRGKIASREYISIPEADLRSDKGRKKGNKEVPQPIRARSKRHTPSAIARRVQFSDDAPYDRTPGSGIKSDEQAREHDHGCTSLWGIRGVCIVQRERSHRSEYQESGSHSNTPDDE